ncbi:unnamed protein product [Owenia fusiformis]|uniref:Uncharacterized protein n=1 Tax=Owenia fusiformis TaxID=6347 RepID=A0A8J1XG36_OWEFU|nr:unnamed protein product [Owenia fusiformis]
MIGHNISSRCDNFSDCGGDLLLLGSGVWFDVIHISGFTSLTISTLFSTGVLIFVAVTTRRSSLAFRLLKLPERLVVYLAICDLMWSTTHIVDHVYMWVTYDHPPDLLCNALAFLLSEFVLAQGLVVSFAAINAMVIVVLGKTIELGRYDWRLVVVALGLPTVWGVVLLVLGVFGPSGAWCLIDARKETYALFNNLYSSTMIVVFMVNLFSYTLVICKVRVHSKNIKQSTQGSAINKIAATSALLILAYFAQWWPWFIYAIWSLIGNSPHIILVVLNTIFCNLGGAFNFFAYSTFRKRLGERNANVTTERLEGCEDEVQAPTSSKATKDMRY